MSEEKEFVPISSTQSPVAVPLDFEVPEEVTTQEINDVIVLTSQLSSDELVTNADIVRTEALIASNEPEGYSLWDIIIKGLVNLVLPFINGLMLGFGEILAHEIGFKYGWAGARVQPARRMAVEPVVLDLETKEGTRRSKQESQFL